MFEKSTAIKALPFYNFLTREQWESLLCASEIRHFHSDENIVGLIENRIGPFLVLHGEIRAVMDDESGREITLYKLYPREMGLLSTACILEYIALDVRFIADADSVLLVTESRSIKEIMEVNLAVKCAIFEMLTDRFSSCMESMRDLIFTRYDKRLAVFLLERYLYTGKTEFFITQEEVAKKTSSVREVAGRTIRRFAEEGILEYGRGKIKLLDVQRLKRMT